MAQKKPEGSIKAYPWILFHRRKDDVVSELTEAASSFCVGEQRAEASSGAHRAPPSQSDLGKEVEE